MAFFVKILDFTNTEYHYYTLDDKTIENILDFLFKSSDKSEYIQSLIDLDEAKLIYRFTVAKKFKERNFKRKQLRINSWGVEYLDSQNNNYNEIYNYISNEIDLYIYQHQEIYKSLTERLLSNLKEIDIENINELNEKVMLKSAS